MSRDASGKSAPSITVTGAQPQAGGTSVPAPISSALLSPRPIVPKQSSLTLSEQLQWVKTGLPDDIWYPIADMAKSVMGGSANHLLEFLCEPEKAIGLTCGCCNQLYTQPTVISLCGHMFCQGCISNLRRCPTCRVTFDDRDLLGDKRALFKMGDLEIACPLGDCEWRGEVCVLLDHFETDCEFFPVVCPLGTCNAQLVRITAPLHIQMCPHKAGAQALTSSKGGDDHALNASARNRAELTELKQHLFLLCGQVGLTTMKIGDPSVHPTEVLVLKQLLPTQKEELAKVIQKIRKTENAMAGDAPFGQVDGTPLVSLTSAYEKVHGVSSSPVSLRGVTPNHSMRDVRSESNPSQFELLRSSSPSTYKKISATASSPGADRQLSSARSAPSSMIALPQSSPSSSTAPNSLASKSVGSSPEPSSSAKPATPFVPRSPAPRSSDTEGSTPSRSDTGTTRTSETNASLVKAGSLFGTLSKTHSPSSLAFSFSVASVSNSDRGSDVPLRRPPSPSPAISSSEMGSSQSSRTLPKDSFGDIGFTSVSPLSISSVPSTMTFTPLDDDGKGTVPMMMFSTFDSRDSSTSALSRESDSYSVGHRYGGTQNGGELAGASGLKSVGLEGRVSEVNAAGGGRGIVDSEKDVVRIDREREERERAARKEAEEAAKALAAEEERRRVLLEETKKKEEEAKRKAEEEEVKRKAEEEKKRIADETAKKNEEAERRRKEKEALEKAEMEKAQKLEEEERAKKAAAEIEERRKAEEVKRREEEERAKEALRKETEEREKALAREAEMRKAEEEERRIAEDRLKPKGSSADVPSTPLTISVSAPSLPSPLTPPYSDFIFTKWLAERITGVSLWESAGESFVSRESRKREREGERER